MFAGEFKEGNEMKNLPALFAAITELRSYARANELDAVDDKLVDVAETLLREASGHSTIYDGLSQHPFVSVRLLNTHPQIQNDSR